MGKEIKILKFRKVKQFTEQHKKRDQHKTTLTSNPIRFFHFTRPHARKPRVLTTEESFNPILSPPALPLAHSAPAILPSLRFCQMQHNSYTLMLAALPRNHWTLHSTSSNSFSILYLVLNNY